MGRVVKLPGGATVETLADGTRIQRTPDGDDAAHFEGWYQDTDE